MDDNKKITTKKNLLFQSVVVNGWVSSFRSNRFIVLNDGSTFNNLQIIVMSSNFSKELLKKRTIGIALQIKGIRTKSTGQKQVEEVISTGLQIYNKGSLSDINKTILPSNRQKLEKLIEQAHICIRKKRFGSILRLRHQRSFCAHESFYSQGFFYLHPPIITSLDTEGLGDMFRVTFLGRPF